MLSAAKRAASAKFDTPLSCVIHILIEATYMYVTRRLHSVMHFYFAGFSLALTKKRVTERCSSPVHAFTGGGGPSLV